MILKNDRTYYTSELIAGFWKNSCTPFVDNDGTGEYNYKHDEWFNTRRSLISLSIF